MNFLTMFISGALLLSGLGAANAQGPDRVTTRERVGKNAEAQFKRQDLDKSGAIEKAEWDKTTEEAVTRLRARMQKRFEEADADKDGKISREEFIAARMKWFDEVDANHDGVLNRDELRDSQRARARQERQEQR